MFSLSLSSAALIIGNLVPIIGVLFFSWELFPIVLLYWIENLVMGVLNIIKLLTNADDNSLIQKLFMSMFFSVHYGLFCFVHGTFLVDLFGKEGDSLQQIPVLIMSTGLKWALMALVISHVFSLIGNYYWLGENKRYTTSDVMFMPYKRIIVLHMVIIFGAMILQSFGVSQMGLIALAAVKIFADLVAHKIEHRS